MKWPQNSVSIWRTDISMHAAVEFAPALGQEECDREAQRDHIVRLLNTGDEEVSSRRYAEATRAYYSVFQPGICGEPGVGLRRVAPIGLYETAAGRLRAVATQFAEQLIECRCFLAGESPDGAVGVPRGALNLYLISNQHDVFTERALQYAVEERATRNINRFLMSSVRARLSHLRHVDACAPLLSEEKEALNVLAEFEAKLRAFLAPQRQARHEYSDTMCT